jgi:fructose-bisphosphate aldolase, class II
LLVNSKDILHDAMLHRYAVGGFDATNTFLVDCIVGAAEKSSVPVILMIPGFSLTGSTCEYLVDYAVNRCRSTTADIVLHLDHGISFRQCVYAVKKGFTSVMVDGSALPFEENTALTKKVTECAHTLNISVEAEIGHVAGDEDALDGSTAVAALFTQPQEAARFVQATEIDSVAVAFGNVHGRYKGRPVLDFDRLEKIRDAVSVPLVMHGGSGISADDFKKVIRSGICKINIFSEISLQSTGIISGLIQKNNGNAHIAEIQSEAQGSVENLIISYIKLFNNSVK